MITSGTDREATRARKFKSRLSKVLFDGREILRGRDMEARRREVFERDGYRCQMPVTRPKITSDGGISYEDAKCGRWVTFEPGPNKGDLAHWPIARWKGRDDRASNLIAACKACHRRQHNREPRFKWLGNQESAA